MTAAERAGPAAADAEVTERSWQAPEQFAVLFDRHALLIHRYAARRIGAEAAEDLVAETFLAAFGKRRGYDLSYTDARPWLYGIATFDGAPSEIILNSVTNACLGDRTWPAPGFGGPGAGAYDGAALVKMAFVNKAGQLP